MLRVALSGNIASGKSTVETYLIERGVPVLDTDKVCHELLVCEEIITAFNSYDVFENGCISRDKLGKLVFANLELKKVLENILYPKVRDKISEFFYQNSSKSFCVVAIPLLFEANMTDLFDKIIFVYCDDEIRKKRLISRNGYTPEYAQIRINSQQSQEEKVKKSDFVIYNNGSIEDLELETDSVLAKLVSLEI